MGIRLVLTSRYLYLYMDLVRGTRFAATNIRTLARKSGLKDYQLRYQFDTLGRDVIEYPERMPIYRIVRLPTDMIFTSRDGK